MVLLSVVNNLNHTLDFITNHFKNTINLCQHSLQTIRNSRILSEFMRFYGNKWTKKILFLLNTAMIKEARESFFFFLELEVLEN